ncbi:MAG TPA: tyrosine-type recombinase/integrase [Candidatus Ventrimonas merdavium]|nr:tyrosine-type recombinase/integrase [Candidatus Ventrimonas merdavium]
MEESYEAAFRTYLLDREMSESTIRSYLYAARQYFSRYARLCPKNLRDYKIFLIETYRPQTVNLRLRGINCYLESIGKDGWKLSSVRVQQKPFLENVISEADYLYFKNCLKRDHQMYWYFVVRFLTATGARISELVQIKVEHVKIGYLDLYSKGGKLRRIYIPASLRSETLQWLKETGQKSGFLFVNKKGQKITARGIAGQLKHFAVLYDLDPTVVYPHSFRHRFAKSFLDRCNDLSMLADLMGHESIETTRIYLRRTSTEQRAMIDQIVDW